MTRSDLTFWIEIFQALLVPTVALAAFLLGIWNHRLARLRRDDELFDRRFAIFQNFLKIVANPERFEIDGRPHKRINVSYIAAEAEFLFDSTISDHMREVEAWVADPRSVHVFSEIVAPFRVFLRR